MSNHEKSLAIEPRHLCLIRLSSIGDVIHTLPIINTLRSRRPQSQITWIVNRTEYELVKAVPGIDFVVFDKSLGWRAYRSIKKRLKGRRFDVLLLMQNSLRANLLSLLVKAPLRIGFDRARAKEAHGLFINHRVRGGQHQHVMDGFFCFTERLGITAKKLVWDHCYKDGDQAFVERLLPDNKKKILLINPCSSSRRRNWLLERYARVADYAAEKHGMQVVLSGAECDGDDGRQIKRLGDYPVVNLIGQTTLPQLMALMARADVAMAPDSGPLHIANAVGTPVIGLFAASNPLRTGAYLYPQWCVNRYPQAVRQFLKRDWQELPWGARVHHDEAMKLITVDDVSAVLDRIVTGEANGSAKSAKQ